MRTNTGYHCIIGVAFSHQRTLKEQAYSHMSYSCRQWQCNYSHCLTALVAPVEFHQQRVRAGNNLELLIEPGDITHSFYHRHGGRFQPCVCNTDLVFHLLQTATWVKQHSKDSFSRRAAKKINQPSMWLIEYQCTWPPSAPPIGVDNYRRNHENERGPYKRKAHVFKQVCSFGAQNYACHN